MNMIQNAKTQVLELTLQAYNKAADAGLLPAGCPVQPSVEIPKDTANGDYTTTFCLAAAKALKKNPRELAQLLLDNMELSGSYFTSAAMAGAAGSKHECRRGVTLAHVQHAFSGKNVGGERASQNHDE